MLLKNDAVPPPADAAAGAPSPSPSASPSAAPLLPLRRADSLALIGSFAEAPRYHGIASSAIVPSSTHHGSTHQAPRYQGAGSSRINAYRIDTPLEAIRQASAGSPEPEPEPEPEP